MVEVGKEAEVSIKLSANMINRAPRLRLVGEAPASAPPQTSSGTTPLSATDPRWVLAVRTSEVLQGAVLPPEQREKLIHLGRTFGLTPFDANLVIAIVQDQARRGHRPEYCPRNGEAQLRMVPLPRRSSVWDAFRGRRALTTALILMGIIAVELVVMMMLLK